MPTSSGRSRGGALLLAAALVQLLVAALLTVGGVILLADPSFFVDDDTTFPSTPVGVAYLAVAFGLAIGAGFTLRAWRRRRTGPVGAPQSQ